jgi:hypothetical protein
MSGKFLSVAAILGMAGMVLVGCDGDTAPTVDWYLAHKADRENKLAACNNDPGHLAKTPACVNAAQADLQEMESGPDAKASGKGF